MLRKRTWNGGLPLDWAAWLLGLAVLAAACGGTAKLIDRGAELESGGQLEEALAEYEKAIEEQPDDIVLERKVADIRRKLATGALENGQAALARKELWNALDSLMQAVRYDSEFEAPKAALKQAAAGLLAEGEGLVGEKKYPEALDHLGKLLKKLPRYGAAKAAVAKAEQSWATQLLEEATDLQERGLHGSALILLVRLRKMVGGLGDSAAREVEAREQIGKAATFTFAVRPAKVAHKLVAGTARAVEKLQQAKVANCPTAAPAGGTAARAVLTVGLAEVTFNEERTSRMAEQKYQSGTRPVDNPAYLELKQKLKETRARLEELREIIKKDQVELQEVSQAFDDAGPDEDESALRARVKGTEKRLAEHRDEQAQKQQQSVAMREQLGKVPRKLAEPVFDTHSYEVAKVVRTATARLQAHARSDDGAQWMRNEGIEASASTEDETNPALPKYGVPADPLTFAKSDEELTDEATEAAAAKLAERIGELCQKWQGVVLARAQQSSMASKTEAVEDYVLLLFLSPDKPPQEAVDFLQRERGLEDVKLLLGTENAK